MDTTNALERLATITPRRYPQGSTIERRPDGRVFVWFPRGVATPSRSPCLRAAPPADGQRHRLRR